MTNDPIDVIVRFRVKPGKLELYKQATDFILSNAEAREPYVVEYNIYKNSEGVYTQYERYTDEAALHRHLNGTMEGQIKWAEAIEIAQVIVLGDMSERFWNLYGNEKTHGYSLFRKIRRQKKYGKIQWQKLSDFMNTVVQRYFKGSRRPV